MRPWRFTLQRRIRLISLSHSHIVLFLAFPAAGGSLVGSVRGSDNPVGQVVRACGGAQVEPAPGGWASGGGEPGEHRCCRLAMVRGAAQKRTLPSRDLREREREREREESERERERERERAHRHPNMHLQQCLTNECWGNM